jgi:hypothetical protein
MEAAICVDAVRAQEESAWPMSGSRPLPAAREAVAPARLRDRSSSPVERKLYRAAQRPGGLEQTRERSEVRDAGEHRGAGTKPGERVSAAEEVRDEVAIGGDEHDPRETLCRHCRRHAHREHSEKRKSELDPHASQTAVAAGQVHKRLDASARYA